MPEIPVLSKSFLFCTVYLVLKFLRKEGWNFPVFKFSDLSFRKVFEKENYLFYAGEINCEYLDEFLRKIQNFLSEKSGKKFTSEFDDLIVVYIKDSNFHSKNLHDEKLYDVIYFVTYNELLDTGSRKIFSVEEVIEAYENYVRNKKLVEKLLREEKVALFVEPIVDRLKEVIACEILSRLCLEEESGERFVSPSEFLPILRRERELYDLFENIVLEKALFAVSRKDSTLLPCHVNFSRKFFISKVELFKKVPAERFILEVIEDPVRKGELFYEERAYLYDAISRLSRDGVKVLFDDFGEGINNVEDLFYAPVSGVKINLHLFLSFCDDSSAKSEFRRFVESLIEFLRKKSGFGFDLYVERVEKAEDFKRICGFTGIRGFQGYYFGKPVLLIK